MLVVHTRWQVIWRPGETVMTDADLVHALMGPTIEKEAHEKLSNLTTHTYGQI